MKDNKVAIFIDAESIESKYIDSIIDTTLQYGNLTIKRIYADWTKPNMQTWRDKTALHSFVALQQFNAMQIHDLMNIEIVSAIYERNIDTFIIVSDENNFIPLLQKLKEHGKQTIGIGTQRVSSYCYDSFVLLDSNNQHHIEKVNNIPTKYKQHILQIIQQLFNTQNHAKYAAINNEMKKQYPHFNIKEYGYTNFRQFMDEIGMEKQLKTILDKDGCTLYFEKPQFKKNIN